MCFNARKIANTTFQSGAMLLLQRFRPVRSADNARVGAEMKNHYTYLLTILWRGCQSPARARLTREAFARSRLSRQYPRNFRRSKRGRIHWNETRTRGDSTLQLLVASRTRAAKMALWPGKSWQLFLLLDFLQFLKTRKLFERFATHAHKRGSFSEFLSREIFALFFFKLPELANWN